MITSLLERIKLRQRRCAILKWMADEEVDPDKKEKLYQLAELQKRLMDITAFSHIKSAHTQLTGETYALTEQQLSFFWDDRCMECGFYLEEYANVPCSLCGSLINQEEVEIALPSGTCICMNAK